MFLFFDLDGPILDVSRRYHTLHRDLLQKSKAVPLDSSAYWQRKRMRMPESAILTELGAIEIEPCYTRRRMELIEMDNYLDLDQPWPWAISILSSLAKDYPLVLVTLRSNSHALERQLSRCNLQRIFKAVLREAAADPVDTQKARLIRDYLKREGVPLQHHWIIGDTEADIGAGRLLGFTTVAVRTGIRDDEHLKNLKPTYLIDDIRFLPDLVFEKPCNM